MLKENLPWSLNSILGALDASLRQSIDWQEWGIENRLIESLRNSLYNPTIQEAERLERASETILHLFVTMFLNNVSKMELMDVVDRIAFSGKGTNIYLSVFLRAGKGDFYNKSKMYSTISSLAKVPLFKNHAVDFRILPTGMDQQNGNTSPFALETTLRSISAPQP